MRNAVKRRLRAAFLDISKEFSSGAYVLIAKRQILDIKFAQIEQNLRWAFKKIQ